MDSFHIQKDPAGGALLLLSDCFLDTSTTKQVATKSRVQLLVCGPHLSDRVQTDWALNLLRWRCNS